MEDLLLTAADAGRLLGLTPAGVKHAVTTGRLRVVKRTARGIRLFERKEVERFRKERETKTGPPEPEAA